MVLQVKDPGLLQHWRRLKLQLKFSLCPETSICHKCSQKKKTKAIELLERLILTTQWYLWKDHCLSIVRTAASFIKAGLIICLFWSFSISAYLILHIENNVDEAFAPGRMFMSVVSFHHSFVAALPPSPSVATVCCSYSLLIHTHTKK